MNKPSNKFVFILVLICTRTEPQSKDEIKTSAKRPESRASITVLVNIIGGGGGIPPPTPSRKGLRYIVQRLDFTKLGKKSEKRRKNILREKLFKLA